VGNQCSHRLTFEIETIRFIEVMAWLHEAGHELHKTVRFGGQNSNVRFDRNGSKFAMVDIFFKDPNDAMLFKLRWC
jgi:nanoRNase/pAp phosphatase (c-di-AMP/oligoRNAs hydrolase)